jgi:hypothetical protein
MCKRCGRTALSTVKQCFPLLVAWSTPVRTGGMFLNFFRSSRAHPKLRHYLHFKKSRVVAESYADFLCSRWDAFFDVLIYVTGVTGIFHWHNPFGRTMALGSTQPLTEMSTRNISWGDKGGRCIRPTNLTPSSADCLKICQSQTPGSLWACPGL